MGTGVYKQAYALIEALWQPLEGGTGAQGPSAKDLATWICRHIGESFPAADDRVRPVPYAFHSWEDYRRGPFDDFFWGPGPHASTDDPSSAVDSACAGAPAGSPANAEKGIRQLLGEDLFDKLRLMLSTTNDACIPRKPYAPADDAEGLWFYGFDNFLSARRGEAIELNDRLCQRGIGPDGALVLRSRPLGDYRIDALDLAKRLKAIGVEQRKRKQQAGERPGEAAAAREAAERRDAPEQILAKQRAIFLDYYGSSKPRELKSVLDERELWDYQYRVQRLRSVLRYRRLNVDDEGRIALDEAICLSYAIACEAEERMGAGTAREALRKAIIAARLSPTEERMTGEPPTCALFTPEEARQLATLCHWPRTATGIAATVASAIIRLVLGAARTPGQALVETLGGSADAGFGSSLKVYLTELATWGDALDLRDAPGDEAASYHDLYVSPAFERVAGGKRRPRVAEGMQDANPACVVAQAEGRVRLLVQAGSGMGKTTFAKGLAAGIAQMQLAGDATLINAIASHDHHAVGIDAFIPVLITQPEPERAGRGFELLERDEPPSVDAFTELLFRQLPPMTFQDPFMAAAHDDEEAAFAFFKMLIASPRALVIVDSIDEVPLTVRDRYIACLDTLARAYGIQRLVITSRPLAAASESRLEDAVRGDVVRLLPFDRSRQQELFENLVARYAPASEDAETKRARAQELFARVSATPGFAAMLANPLVATALVRALVGTPGISAYDALRTLTELLPKLYKRDPYDDVLLARIAHDLACDGTDTIGDVLEFSRRYTEYRAELRIANAGGPIEENAADEHLIDRMVTRRGILTMRGGEIVFEHALIQAFFAARHVINELLKGGDDEEAGQGRIGRARQLYRQLLAVAYHTQDNDAAFLAVLVLLSAWMPYNAPQLDNLHTEMYADLASDVLFGRPVRDGVHDGAVALFAASHAFDFGEPCPRDDEVLVWESRLAELGGLAERRDRTGEGGTFADGAAGTAADSPAREPSV